MTTTTVAVAWRFFDVRVAAVRRLSPTFVRLTLSGPDLDRFADNGWDQRFKIVLPDAFGGFEALPREPDWYAVWRTLPTERQNPIRTYTVRAVRPGRREVDVDMVLHGDGGPASRFAARASLGEPLVLLGPDAEHEGVHGGLEFRPPADHLGPTLLVGDETAVPALLSILGSLPEQAYGEALLEVPEPADIVDVRVPPGLRITWVTRAGGRSALPDAVRDATGRLGMTEVRSGRVGGDAAAAVDGSDTSGTGSGDEPFWDVPDAARPDRVYAWIAGESSMVTGLRRYLVRDLGIDRGAVAFMGYWRRGRAG